MGLSFKSLLFAVALVVYTSNVHVIAEVDDNYSESYDSFDCDAPIPVTKLLDVVCPDHGIRSDNINDRIASLVDSNFKTNHAQCNADVDKVCSGLPKQVQAYTTGGIEQCKQDFKEILCEKQLSRQDPIGKRIYCSYLKATEAIMPRSPTNWCRRLYPDAGSATIESCIFYTSSENHRDNALTKSVCNHFQPNGWLYFHIITKQCDRIPHKFGRTLCKRGMRKILGY